ncbi:hypothetical protein [Pseudomonas serbica]|jgi:hypothetical protein
MEDKKLSDEVTDLIKQAKIDDSIERLLNEAERLAVETNTRIASDRIAALARSLMVGPIRAQLISFLKSANASEKHRSEIESQWIQLTDAHKKAMSYFDSLRDIILFEQTFRPSGHPEHHLFDPSVDQQWISISALPAPSGWADYLEDVKFALKATELWRPAPAEGFFKYFGVQGGTTVLNIPWVKRGKEISEFPMIAVKEGHFHRFVRVLQSRGKAYKQLDAMDASYKKIQVALAKLRKNEHNAESLESILDQFCGRISDAYIC